MREIQVQLKGRSDATEKGKIEPIFPETFASLRRDLRRDTAGGEFERERSGRHRYTLRDFDVAQLLLTLRSRTRLTQKEVARQIGLSEKSVRNWENGTNYPSDYNLRNILAVYLSNNALLAGYEREEVRLLWELVHKHNPQRMGAFDEQWFASVLQKWQTQRTSQSQPAPGKPQSSVPVASHSTSRLLRRDWSEALDVSCCYGRADELAELEHWLLTDRCRLIALQGMGGSGKTMLAIKLAQRVMPSFECVLWRSLQNAPSLEDILHDWIPYLSEQRSIYVPHDTEQNLAVFISLLQERRCLVVLDNLETVFQDGVLDGGYRQGYEAYAMLIRQVAQSTHQSCLLLTSREFFRDVGIFPDRSSPVRVFRVPGLAMPACQLLLQGKELAGEPRAWNELVQRYGGNPLALKVAAEIIHEIFDGDIAAFLAEGLTVLHSIHQILTQQLERLSPLEQTVIRQFASQPEPISLETLRASLVPTISACEMMEAVHSLQCRSLVERGEGNTLFTLPPVVLQYVTEHWSC